MASLVEELINIIEEETGCYKTFLELANNKKDVIINGDLPSLQELTREEQELAGQLLRLEKKREENLKDICIVTNKKQEEMTVTILINMLENQQVEKNKLKNVSNELSKVINKVKDVNDLNKKLIEQSLDFIDFTMNAIQSSRANVVGNSYQQKGSLNSNYQGKNFFDAKQ